MNQGQLGHAITVSALAGMSDLIKALTLLPHRYQVIHIHLHLYVGDQTGYEIL